MDFANGTILREFNGGLFLKNINLTIDEPSNLVPTIITYEAHVTNTTEINEDVCEDFDRITAILIGIICVIGILSNILSLCVLSKYKGDAESVFLLKALTVSDILLLVTTIIVYTPGAFNIPLKNHSAIILYIWPVAMMTHTTTVWITVMLSYNRFTAVCRIGEQSDSWCSSLAKFLTVVGCAIIYNIPRFFEHRHVYLIDINVYNNDSNISREEIFLGDSKMYQIIYSNVLYYPVMFIVPLGILIILNVKLISTLKSIKQRRRMMTGHKAKDDHVTLIIIVIVFMFIFCQTPALINQIFWAIFSTESRECGRFHFYYTKISDVMVIFNSAINFAIYCLFGKAFRKLFFSTIFCKKVPRNNINDQAAKHMLKQSTVV